MVSSYYTDDIALLTNTTTRAESLLHSLKRATGGIGLHVNADKIEYVCFNQRDDITKQNGVSLKLMNKFTYIGSSALSTETVIITPVGKAETSIDRLSVICKSVLARK